MANEQNLTPFKKGHPGMGGRPKGSLSFKTLFKMVLDHEMDVKDPNTGALIKKSGIELVINKHFRKALAGDMAAIKEVYDRYDGKVPTTNIHAGDEEGGAMKYELKNVSKEQTDAIVRIGNESTTEAS